MDPKHIVIIGGSYAGTKVAHQILKQIPNSRVTLVDPSDVFYYNIAAPRIIAKPKEARVDQYLIPIMDKFKQYPESRFSFVQGYASSVDTTAKIVSVRDGKDIKYDYLVVASGSTTPGTVGDEAIPFKTTGADIREKVEAAQKRVAAADSIIIIGAGPVGVESAGEIAQAYPRTKAKTEDLSCNSTMARHFTQHSLSRQQGILPTPLSCPHPLLTITTGSRLTRTCVWPPSLTTLSTHSEMPHTTTNAIISKSTTRFLWWSPISKMRSPKLVNSRLMMQAIS